jgi:anaerobic selenocysteine-containing dehydrogenase
MLTSLAALPETIADPLRETWTATPPWNGRPVQFVDVFPNTPDRKVHLCPPALDAEAPHGLYHFQADPASDAYPLSLISPATDRTINSTLGEAARPDVVLDISDADAAARGIADGDLVRVFNALGSVEIKARVTPLLRPGTVSMPKGVWRRHSRNGLTATALAPDTLTDLGGGACYNDARVNVRAVITAH